MIINFKYVFDIIPPPFPTYLHVALLHFTTSLIYNRYYLTRYGLPSEPWTRLERMIHLHITYFPPIKPVNQMSFLKEEVIMSLMNQYFFSFFFVFVFPECHKRVTCQKSSRTISIVTVLFAWYMYQRICFF